MAENSRIEWTDHTFNPWYGCTKVAPGWRRVERKIDNKAASGETKRTCVECVWMNY